MKKLLLALVLVLVCTGCYNFRGFLPIFLLSYPQRLEWLNGWSSNGYYAFNCSGLVAFAHGEDWVSEKVLYKGDDGALSLIAEWQDKDSIREWMLIPGDMVVFGGAEGNGIHVVSYLGDGRWIDSDARRGYVAEWQMNDKYLPDPWFEGKARAYRWRIPAKTQFNPRFFGEEQNLIGRQ